MEDLNRNGQNGHNGNGHNGNGHNGAKTPSSIVKDFVAIMFRRGELMKKVFLWTALGTLIAVFLFGVIYESDMEVMVRSDMVEAAVTPDTNDRTTSNDLTMQINSEVEMLMSQDVLREVVDRCPMLVEGTSLPSRLARQVTSLIPGYEETKFPDAVKKLASKLEVTAVKDASNITVTYTSTDPVKSGCVMANLADVYMAKRNVVNRPPKLYNFFAQQTENYRTRLLSAEQKLLAFANQQDAVMAGTQAQMAVTQGNQFLASLRNVQQQIQQTKEQIAALEAQQGAVPPRIETSDKAAENINLLSNLKNTLNTLENTRTDYMFRYDPNYRLVQDVEKQIEQTNQMIAKQADQPTREWTTDNNPTYQWVVSQLAQSRTTLPSMQAEAKAIAGTVRTYQNEAKEFNKKSVTQDDLTREVKAEEGNYLLYLAKREQARISDMLDSRRIQNVTFDESPTWPAIPVFSPLLLITLSFVLAAFLSVGVGLTVDYLDPSFRTPDEVKDYLDIPVFASIPANGHEVPVGTAPKNGH